MPALAPRELLAFMRQEPYAVQASTSASGAPQAALVGIVVTERFEVFFDTLGSSRKIANLRRDPFAALVIGPTASGSARTVQFEGVADEPQGPDLERLLTQYVARFPDGRARQSWPGVTYVRITPTWIRHSDFSTDPPQIDEFGPEDLLTIR